MSLAVSMSSGIGMSRSQQTALTRARSAPNAARIWVNMSPGTVVTTSIDRLGRIPNFRALLTGGQPWPICVSTCGGDRDRAAGVGDPLPLVVAEVAAVDVRRVRPEQAEPVELLDHAEPTGHPAHADVHGERDAELAGQLPLGAVTTWSWVNPGPRVARPIVISPSSPGMCVERTRRTSSPGIASALKNQYFSSDVFALP